MISTRLKNLLIAPFLLIVLYGQELATGQKSAAVDSSASQYRFANRFAIHQRWRDREVGAAAVLGPYRTYQSSYLEISSDRDLVLWDENEIRLYRDLLASSVRPEFFLIEFTEYPLAWLSAWLEERNSVFYDSFSVSDDVNLIRSLGAGGQEPWSVSLFLGRLGSFWDLDENYNLVEAASGAVGLVITGGMYQLFDNHLIRSDWARLEWKLKGEGRQGGKINRWDIKLGYRWFGLSAVPDALSLVLSRMRTNQRDWSWALHRNSSVNLEVQAPVFQDSGQISRLTVIYGKVFPVGKVLAGLKLGFGYEYRRLYDTKINSFVDKPTRLTQIYFQPVIIF
ncbi:MAG: hypothetical protein ABIA75_13000 [Candidatus Neomarinimicrobiota bacterium]